MYFELRKWIMDITQGMDSSRQKAALKLPILLFIKIPHCDRVYAHGRSNERYFAKYLCTQKAVEAKLYMAGSSYVILLKKNYEHGGERGSKADH